MNNNQLAVLCTNSWAGRREIPCRIVGETLKAYRVEVLAECLVPKGRLESGEQCIVPKTAVRIVADGPEVMP